MNPPTPQGSYDLPCPSCAGRGVECDRCEPEGSNSGTFSLTQCPRVYAGASIAQALRFADFARRGSWPVSGGVLDQCAWFVRACEAIEAARADVRARLKASDPIAAAVAQRMEDM